MSEWFARQNAEEILELIDAVLDGRYKMLMEDKTERAYVVNVRLGQLDKCNDDDKPCPDLTMERDVSKKITDSRADGQVPCAECYGTGRWGPNGSLIHEPCHGTGKPAPNQSEVERARKAEERI
jgi:hypothetical protein